jgi:hypothetical protein
VFYYAQSKEKTSSAFEDRARSILMTTESASVSEELKVQAEELHHMVSGLVGLVKGRSAQEISQSEVAANHLTHS